MKKNKQFLQINLSVFIYISYILFILCNDYINYIFSIDASIITYGIALAVLFIIFLILKKYIKIKRDNLNKIDILFFILLMFIFILRFTIPDSSFDTLNYHLYQQKNLFKNNVSYNFFPARWINTFSFPLGDRMHYFVRYFLGYRLGMVLNIFTILVIYYQLKRLLAYIIKKNDIVISVSAIVIIFTEQIMTNMITYYTDLFVIPILLEIILIIINKDKNYLNNYFVLLLAGISVSLKISNGIFLIPLAVIYLIKYKDKINIKTIVIGIIIFIFPIIIYMINNYIQTGNPIFPFYNSIFKSPYLTYKNWIEEAYGPKTIFERLFWPFYTLIKPRRCYDTDIYYGRIAFGYGIALITIIFAIIKKLKLKNKNIFGLDFYLSILMVIISLFWSNFMMGYIRYALILEILSGVISVYFIYLHFNKNVFISIIAICSLSYVCMLTVSDLIRTPTELSWRYPYYLNKSSYKNNLLNFNKKYDYTPILKNIKCIGITDYNAGYGALLTRDIPIIDMHQGYANNYGKNKYNKIINKCENIYTISTSATYERTIGYVKFLGYESTGKIIKTKTEFVNYDDDLILFEIKKVN